MFGLNFVVLRVSLMVKRYEVMPRMAVRVLARIWAEVWLEELHPARQTQRTATAANKGRRTFFIGGTQTEECRRLLINSSSCDLGETWVHGAEKSGDEKKGKRRW
jgi:hypothetical protein